MNIDPANAGGGYGGGVNPYTAGTLSLLGGSDGGGIFGGRGNFQEDGSVVNANIVSNRDFTNIGHNVLSREFTAQHDSLSRQIESNRIDDKFNQITLGQRDIIKAIADCCCQNQLGQNNIVAINNSNTADIKALLPDPSLTAANATIARLEADLRDDRRRYGVAE